MDKDIADYKKEHANNYLTAIKDIIGNNTLVLKEEIFSLVQKPPLESMDVILSKALKIAKKNKLVLNKNKLDHLLVLYRKSFDNAINEICNNREEKLIKIVDDKDFDYESDKNVIKINKKDFNDINKKNRVILKKQIEDSFSNVFLPGLTKLFSKDEKALVDVFINDLSKYMKAQYQKQLMDSYDIKVLVKDTTLINNVNEQGERYLFTLKNSHLFN